MILAKSPFRISFAGGGSDLPDFYRRQTGVVVSTTIDKAMYIAIHPYFHEKIRIKYSRTEDVSNTSEIQHPLVRECLAKIHENAKKSLLQRLLKMSRNTRLKPYTTRMTKIQGSNKGR